MAAPVRGWKIGRVADDLVPRHHAQRIAGPILTLYDGAGGDPVPVPLLKGFAAVEGEILIRLDQIVAPDVDDDVLLDAIGAVRLGVEIASSPFPGINQHGPTVTVSDFGNNYGLIVGPLLNARDPASWLTTTIEVDIDSVTVGTGRSIDVIDGPLGAVRFILSHLQQRGRPLTKAQWISCGAVTGVHEFRPEQTATVTLGDAIVRCVGVAAATTCAATGGVNIHG
jgi:2-keto-4-pentenoate hydratase